jgi:hypothetical protein
MLGFRCKKCGRPFLVVHEGDVDKVVRQYQLLGHRLVPIPVMDLDKRCECPR